MTPETPAKFPLTSYEEQDNLMATRWGNGFKGEGLSFFELFRSPVADFEEKARLVIDAGISQGVEPRAIKEASRMLQVL